MGGCSAATARARPRCSPRGTGRAGSTTGTWGENSHTAAPQRRASPVAGDVLPATYLSNPTLGISSASFLGGSCTAQDVVVLLRPLRPHAGDHVGTAGLAATQL